MATTTEPWYWRWLRHFVAFAIVVLTGCSVVGLGLAAAWGALPLWLVIPLAAGIAAGGAVIVVDLEGE